MIDSSKGGSLCVRILTDEASWDAVEAQWTELFVASPTASTPLRFSWLRTWWRHYGRSYGAQGRGLQIITVWRGPVLVAALPLYQRMIHVSFLGVRRLGFLSTGEVEGEETCPDYLNLLCLPGEEAAVMRVIQDTCQRLDWDFLELVNIPAGSPLLTDHSWCRGPWEMVSNEGCPISNLKGGFEKYLSRLTSKYRKNARRALRAAAEAGAIFEMSTAETSGEFFADLVRIHQERWNAVGKPGCFSAKRFTEFHRALATEEAPAERALLGRLSAGGAGGKRLAVIYGFVTRGKFDVYQCGVEIDGEGPVASPGVAAHLLMMEQLAQRGITAYDFLRGSSQYKNSLSTEKNPLYTVRAWKPSIRAIAHRSALFLRVGIKKAPEEPQQPQVA